MITIAINETLLWLILSLIVAGWGGTWIWARGDRFDNTNDGGVADILFSSVTIVAVLIAFVCMVLVFAEGVQALA